MKIINPTFAIQNKDWNLFNLRKMDYEQILPLVKQIVEPVTEIGFVIDELDLKDSRFSSGELSKTSKQTITIKMHKGSSAIDLSFFIPKLIDDNYVYINGRKKIPLFQLFDIPVITRGENIKLKTNVASIMIYREKEPKVYISFLGKKYPFCQLIAAYYDSQKIQQKFNLSSQIDKNSTNLFENLREDLFEYLNNSIGYTQDDFILDLGKIYSKYNSKSKAEDIIYALDLIPKVDPMSCKFLTTGSIMEELLLILQTGFIDDLLFTNKRIRIFEYMITSKLSKNIFDLCVSNRTAKSPKFNTNSNQIISECNVSDIVQFDFSINPIEELTKLSRCSLLGPGGFKRESIPKHLRDISPTMFGRVCPVDTPDRDNCGVLQNLIVNVDLDRNLKFTEKICDKQPISIPVSMTPFLKHDDQTRLQMASSQMRQAIMLKDFDTPIVSTGCEGLYTEHSQFIKKAKKDGTVVHVDNDYLIVMYDDGQPEIFNVAYRKIYVDHLDYINIYVKIGDKFKAGEILAESNFCKNGNINIGKNLLTAVMVYYGNNYEDGIIISDRLQKDDSLTSVHYKDLSFSLTPDKVLLSLDKTKYKPLPIEFEKIQKNDPYAIIKKLNFEEHYSVFTEEMPMCINKNMLITDVNIYANDWNHDIPEYKDWVEKKLQEQQDKEKGLHKILTNFLDKEQVHKFVRDNNLDKFSHTGKYKNKKEKLFGMNIEIFGIYFRKIQVGDKIANRHGNKGVISRIQEHEKMPQLEDGRHVDICINPLGIISRMNIGQLYELHLSMSIMDLKSNIYKMLDENKNQDEIKKYLIDYIKIIDTTEGRWYLTQFVQQIPNVITKEFIQELNIIQPPFESCKFEDLEKALKYTNSEFTYKVYDPVSKVHLTNNIAVGSLYFLRMVHIAEEKLSARGIGAYVRRTLQPLGGRKNRGGQKCGEMETACLIGHDAPNNLFEFLTTKSDCIDLKNNYIRNVIETGMVDKSKEVDVTPESVKLLNSYLTVLGVKIK